MTTVVKTVENLADRLTGRPIERILALKELEAMNSLARDFLPMVSLLAKRDPHERAAMTAVYTLGAWSGSSPEALAALSEIAADPAVHLQARSTARGRLVFSEIEAASRKLSTETELELELELERLARLAKPAAQGENPYASIQERTAKALAALGEPKDLIGKMLKAALDEERSALQAAMKSQDWDRAAVAAQRLERHLESASASGSSLNSGSAFGFGLNALPAGPGQSLPAASGHNQLGPMFATNALLRTGRSAMRLILRPWILAALAPAFNAGIFAVSAVYHPFLKKNGALMLVGLVVLYSLRKQAEKKAGKKGGNLELFWWAAFLALLSVAIFTSIPIMEAWLYALVVLNVGEFFLYGLAIGAWLDPRLGLLDTRTRRAMRRAMRKSMALSPLDEQGKTWLGELGGFRWERRRALDEMRREPAKARPLLPAVRALLWWADIGSSRWQRHDDPDMNFTDHAILDLLADWGDDESIRVLESITGATAPELAGRAKELLERVRAERAAVADLERLVQIAKPAAQGENPYASIQERTAEALAALGEPKDLIGKMLKAALEEEGSALQAAMKSQDWDRAAVAAQRLERHMESSSNSDSSFGFGLNVLPAASGHNRLGLTQE